MVEMATLVHIIFLGHLVKAEVEEEAEDSRKTFKNPSVKIAFKAAEVLDWTERALLEKFLEVEDLVVQPAPGGLGMEEHMEVEAEMEGIGKRELAEMEPLRSNMVTQN
jgi:hypothetical protein